MNSGRLNVGLATTAPNRMLRYCNTYHHKRTCGLVDKKLQRERATMNRFFPRAIIGRTPNPRIPVVIGAMQQIVKEDLWNREDYLE
jgi:hypothetical protein